MSAVKVAFVLYDGFTALDFVGAYDPVTRVRTMGFRDDVEWDLWGLDEAVTATGGLTIETTAVHPIVRRLRRAVDCRYKASVCTGALLLAAAGLVDGRRATTHPTAYEALAERATVSERRVVRDGDVVTGRGVSAALDVGLYLSELLTDAGTRERIATQMDYPHYRDAVDRDGGAGGEYGDETDGGSGSGV